MQLQIGPSMPTLAQRILVHEVKTTVAYQALEIKAKRRRDTLEHLPA